MILHVNNDLMLSSTARSHAKSQGVEIAFANSMNDAIEKLQNGKFDLCMADLQMKDMQMKQLSDTTTEKQIPTVVYVQHVQVETLEEAKTLGFAEVMTRGQFNKSLGQVIANSKVDKA